MKNAIAFVAAAALTMLALEVLDVLEAELRDTRAVLDAVGGHVRAADARADRATAVANEAVVVAADALRAAFVCHAVLDVVGGPACACWTPEEDTTP